MKINDAIFGVVLLLLGIVILVHVQAFPTIPGQKYGPALFPGSAAAVIVVCALLLIVSGLRERAGGRMIEFAAWTRSGRHLGAFFAIVAGVVAYLLLVDAVGFLLLATALLVGWFLVLRVRPLPAVVTAVIVTALIWYSFYKVLRVPLPWGILQNYAF
jgi:putative tricarboxylic transport membrane protein